MPELPEVQTFVSDLKAHIVGYKITKAWVANSYNKIPNKKDYIDKVTNKNIVNIHRIAKNILIELHDGSYILFHLAMTGQIHILKPDQISGKKAHILLQLHKDQEIKIVTFFDVRMFGKSQVLTKDDLKQLKDKYGDEPIAEDIQIEKVYETIKKRRIPIKNILMDQSILAGLGNIYATEALYLAKIDPLRPANKISLDELKNVVEAAKVVLKQGIKNRGATLPDKMYVDVWGEPGNQQNFFNIYLKSKCPGCETKVENVKIAGRSTYYCPSCQK